jgi:hypothetical protein
MGNQQQGRTATVDIEMDSLKRQPFLEGQKDCLGKKKIA